MDNQSGQTSFQWSTMAAPVGHISESYHPPYLCRKLRLVVSGSVITRDGVTVDAIRVFGDEVEVPMEVQRVHPVYRDKLGTCCFRVTVANLKALIDLPTVDEETRAYAANLLVEYVYRPEAVAMQAQVFKATTDLKTSTAHRVPVEVHRVTHEVVVPLTQAQKVANMFGGKFLPSVETQTEVKRDPVPDVMEFQRYSMRQLYSQQLIGAWAIYHARHYPLWFDMRVGKTLTAIVAFKRLRAEGQCQMLVVVCPRDNMWTPWLLDLADEGLRGLVLDGTKVQDEAALAAGDYDAIILNYERVGSRTPMLRAYTDDFQVMMVFDESKAIKEMSASRTQACHELAFDAAWSTCLNGTPASQGPASLYGQYRVVDPWGLRFGPTFSHYSDRYLEWYGYKWCIRNDGVSNIELENLVMLSSLRYLRFEADQFSGKDKQYRYIQMRPTKEMRDQARNIAKGFTKSLVDGAVKEGHFKDMILVIYGMLRELACGYDKYQEVEGAPYRHARHSVDPKILWVQCFLTAHPDEALVIYTEFNEQEQRLKEVLDEMGITWSSRKPRAKLVTTTVIKQLLEWSQWIELCLLRDLNPDSCLQINGMVVCPEAWRFNVTDLPAHLLESDEYYVDVELDNRERAQQVTDFNNGVTQVFILKTRQGFGISLHRKNAHQLGTGTYPSIVRLAPSWSLDDHQQSGDRCVCTDDKTGKSVCTMEYVLFMPGMEKRIVDSLRAKSEVQATLLHDATQEGYESFVNTLVEEMAGTKLDGDELFDVQDTLDRMACGVPPLGKLTQTMIERSVRHHLKVTLSDLPQDHAAYRLLAKVTV